MMQFKRKNKMVQMVENIISPPKIATVEEIHAEFDSAEARILNKCDAILAELKIPTETQLEKKAKIMEELGFINNETVIQAKSFFNRNKEIEKKREISKTQLEAILDLKTRYSEKFITIDELNRICEKYNLIHAPVANYIKDIPEKNVHEIKNVKKLYDIDILEDEYILKGLASNYLLELFDKKEPIFKLSDLKKANYSYESLKRWFLKGETTWAYSCVDDGVLSKKGKKPEYNDYDFKSIEKINKSGLFIAAPLSHFNLKDLDKKSQYGYFNVEKYEVKDPVVYEYCNNGICRIVTKWGTDDDKSYLDPILLNEIEN